MKKWISLSLLIASIMLMSFALNKKKKVVFFGDSITQMGADKGGYIRLMEELIQSENLSNEFELVGAGIGGNKVTDLFLRLEKDVLSQQPDIVVIYVGINDIWHKRLSGTGTDYAKFASFYDVIVKKLQAAKIKVIVCTPSVIGERKDHSNEQDGELNLYSNWIRTYAKSNQLPCVDLRNEFQQYLIANNPSNEEKGLLTTDRVHLNAKGNLLVAQAVWKELKAIK
jgi:lysophospholipase L1-like esterase